MSDLPSPTFAAEELLRHRSWVRALARALVRDEATADDVEQETWLAALESPPAGGETATTWLARVVRSRAVDGFRRRTRRAARERAAARAESVPSADETVARAEAHRRVVEAVMGLDEPCRTAVLLRYFDDVPPREIARRTGVPVETARTRVRRGVERLRARLAPPGDARSRGALLLLVAPVTGPDGARAGARAAAAGRLAAGVAMSLFTKTMLAVAALAALLAGAALTTSRDAGGTAVVASAEAPADPVRPRRVRAERAAVGPDEALPAATEPESPPRPPHLRIRREDGGPVQGATVVLHDDKAVLAVTRVGDDGSIALQPSDEERRLVVVLDGRAPQGIPLPPVRGDAEIVLPRGAVVAGRLLVEGREPNEEVRLSIWLDQPVLPLDLLMRGERRDERVPDVQATRVRTARDGSFRCEGFAEDARGAVSPPWGWFPKPEDAGRFLRPRADLTIDGARKPRLTGRVVRRGTGDPLPDATILLSWKSELGGGDSQARAEADGTFAIYFTERVQTPARDLVVSEANGIPALRRVLSGPFDRDIVLGDLEVEDPSAVRGRLRVVDGAGRPVAGAVAVFASGGVWNGTSGPDGVVEVPAGGLERRVIVGASAHGVIETTVAPGRAPADVVLPPGALLRVRVREAPRGAVVRVGADHELFDEPSYDVVHVLRPAIGASEPDASLRNGAGGDVSWYRLDDGGVVAVPWIRPGAAFRVEVFDAWGEPVASSDVVLRAGECRDLALTAPAARSIAGRVTGPDGGPVAGTTVVARSTRADDAKAWSGGWARQVLAAHDGRFALEGACAQTLVVLVSAPSHTPWARRVDAGAGDVDVKLTRGPSLRVVVRNADGTPAGDALLAARPTPDSPLFGLLDEYSVSETDEPGTWILSELPEGGVDLTVGPPDRQVTARTRTDRGVVVITLPAPAKEE